MRYISITLEIAVVFSNDLQFLKHSSLHKRQRCHIKAYTRTLRSIAKKSIKIKINVIRQD